MVQHKEEWVTPTVVVYGDATEITKTGAKCKIEQLSDDFRTGIQTVDPSYCHPGT